MKRNSRLEDLRKQIPQSVKDEVDGMLVMIDTAYELGCIDTEQKLFKHGVMQTLPFSFVEWYSGMQKEKIESAYQRWMKEGNVAVGNGAAGQNVSDGLCDFIKGQKCDCKIGEYCKGVQRAQP